MSDNHKIAQIESDKCIGCGVCVATCSSEAIVLGVDFKASVNPQVCTGCSSCVDSCSTKAISMVDRQTRSLSVKVLKFALGATIKILTKIEKRIID